MLTLANNCQPHRSTDVVPFEIIIPRRIPNLSVRNLPPETSLEPRSTLIDGSSLAFMREFLARIPFQIPAVVKALRKTQQHY